MKTVKAKPILNDKGETEESRIVLVGASTDESRHDGEEESPNLEDLEKASRDRDKEELNNLLKRVEEIVADIYQWRCSNWLFKSKMKALQLLADLVDYSDHVMSMRFSYLVSFSHQSPFENISDEIDNVRSLYTSIIWEKKKNLQ